MFWCARGHLIGPRQRAHRVTVAVRTVVYRNVEREFDHRGNAHDHTVSTTRGAETAQEETFCAACLPRVPKPATERGQKAVEHVRRGEDGARRRQQGAEATA